MIQIKNRGFNAAIADKDKAIKSYETRSVKTRIAHEAGLGYDAIDFLRGEDEESITKSAEALKTLLGTRTAPPVVNEPKISEADSSREAAKKLVKKINERK